MSAADRVWKIRDIETGLFWGGPARQCSDETGTRFARPATLSAAVALIIKEKGFFPNTWEVIEVELIEKVVGSPRSGAWMQIDSSMMSVCKSLVNSRNGIDGSEAIQLVTYIRELRRKDTLSHFNAIGLRDERFGSGNWKKFVEAMAALNVEEYRFHRLPNGWVAFYDTGGATAARLNGELSTLLDMETLLTDMARLLKVDRVAI